MRRCGDPGGTVGKPEGLCGRRGRQAEDDCGSSSKRRRSEAYASMRDDSAGTARCAVGRSGVRTDRGENAVALLAFIANYCTAFAIQVGGTAVVTRWDEVSIASQTL